MKAFRRELKFESYTKPVERDDLIEKNLDYYKPIFESFDKGEIRRSLTFMPCYLLLTGTYTVRWFYRGPALLAFRFFWLW